jgi:hypothetical protein
MLDVTLQHRKNSGLIVKKRVNKLFLYSKRLLEFRAQSERRGKARLQQPERAFSTLGSLWSAN